MSETNAMQPARRGAAMVLFSGGQDSTTCLAWALSRFERVETLALTVVKPQSLHPLALREGGDSGV